MNSEGAYNKYGDPTRKIEIGSIGKHGTLRRNPYSDLSDGESLIAGRFVYEVADKPLSTGCAKTGAYVGENRKLTRDFARNVFRSSWGRMRRRQLYNYR